jgi:hypothetical protein
MNFAPIDAPIRSWATRNQLPLSTRYQDEEVRSLELVGKSGRVQIWVETNGEVTVYVWDYRKRKQSFQCDASSVEAALDNALQVARGWCGSP